MTELFFKLADLSIDAGWLVLAVIASRFLLKKAPKSLHCCLWILVAVRLVCPFSWESVFSLMPERAEVPKGVQFAVSHAQPGQIVYSRSEPVQEDAGEQPRRVSYVAVPTFDGETRALKVSHPDAMGVVLGHAGWIWLGGMTLMCAYAAVSYLRIRKRIRVSLELSPGVLLCDYIDTPFILGILRPKICLPSEMNPADAAHVLAHEKAHLRRRDHWWKPLGYLLLSIYWFHPLLWLAYILLCRDIELACDERVVKTMEETDRRAYSEALLKCSVPRHLILACPLAFGEVGVKQRIRAVLNYRKPGFWILLISILVIAVVAFTFLTDPVNLESPFEKDLWATELIYSHGGNPVTEAPSELWEVLRLSTYGGNAPLADYYYTVFTELELAEDNFDVYFDDSRGWLSGSAERFRKNNAGAWYLYNRDDFSYSNYLPFYYLLQQKNGDLYLTKGRLWQGNRKPGVTRIEWMVKLEQTPPGILYTDGSTPFFYTRTLKKEHLQSSSFALSIYDEDGTMKEETLWSEEILHHLHCIPENAFSLGTPVQNVEVSCNIDLNGGDIYDILLRYGDEKVDIVLNQNAPWEYGKTGDKVWIIDFDPLTKLFAQYSPKYDQPAFLDNLDDPYRWCQEMDSSLIEYAQVSIISELKHYGGYFLETNQLDNLLVQLKNIPEDAFIPADTTTSSPSAHENPAIFINWTPMHLQSITTFHAALEEEDGKLYLSFLSASRLHCQRWEIQNETFLTYFRTLFNLAEPYDFHRVMYPEDTITVSHGYANLSLPVYPYNEHEVVEYSDDKTPFGIRFRPKAVDEGWLYLQFCPGGFTPEETWEPRGTEGSYWSGNEPLYCFQDYHLPGQNCWHTILYCPCDRAEHYTNLPGDYVLLNEGADDWVSEYYYEISNTLGSRVMAEGYLNREKILEIADSLLNGTPYQNKIITTAGVRYTIAAAFDYPSGLWTLTYQGKDDQEPTPVLQLDTAGNVVWSILP